MKCPWCQLYVKIVVGFNRIEKRVVRELHEVIIVTAERA